MNATEKGHECCAVLGKRVVGNLNLAAKVIAANSESARRASENRKAVGAANEMVRTKCEAPCIAVGDADAAGFVVVGCESCGERAIGDLRFGGSERLGGDCLE